jgi:hypothetical protein
MSKGHTTFALPAKMKIGQLLRTALQRQLPTYRLRLLIDQVQYPSCVNPAFRVGPDDAL